MSGKISVPAALLLLSWSALASAAPSTQPARADWGAPQVTVTHDANTWTLTGQKQSLTLNAADLSFTVHSGETAWPFLPSQSDDAVFYIAGKDVPVRLADAVHKSIVPYDTGYQTGVKVTLDTFPPPAADDAAFHATVYLTLTLDGPDEDVAFTISAKEGTAGIHRLDWPPPLDGSTVDYTLLPAVRGVLLPRNYPKPYLPMRAQKADGSQSHPDERTDPQSNVIEDWSMSWWGWVKGHSAAMTIIETPDDAALRFSHPAGGPTTLGPRWRESLGHFAYVRTGRLCFFPQGTYVTLAKRYRQYAIDTGLFVPLTEKIAARPIVKQLIGTPFSRIGALTNIKQDSLRYSTTNPSFNHHVTTFDQIADRLKSLKQSGIDRFMLVLTSWPKEGYDRQHPDVLPPAPQAGGYEGMTRLAQTCKDLGYLFTLHDQYRDYYTDAPSFSAEFAVHEQDDNPLSTQFPGSRFGQWKKGNIAYMNNWDGGEMAYLNPRFMLGHCIKNYQGLFAHHIHPDGSYQDVFGYVPPDQDFNPEHPTTRTQGREERIKVLQWCRAHLGITGTEAGCDWTVPYVDYVTPPNQDKAITVPLYNLVYHDAVMSPGSPNDPRSFLNACFPQLGGRQQRLENPTPDLKRLIALHTRVALLEMTNHEFLDKDYRKERTTFSDGTTVTVDWDTKVITISPDLDTATSARHN